LVSDDGKMGTGLQGMMWGRGNPLRDGHRCNGCDQWLVRRIGERPKWYSVDECPRRSEDQKPKQNLEVEDNSRKIWELARLWDSRAWKFGEKLGNMIVSSCGIWKSEFWGRNSF